MTELETWEIPSAKKVIIELTDADGEPVNFADHDVLQIEVLINKVTVKKFALEGDEFSDNIIEAVIGEPAQCTVSFDMDAEEEEEDAENVAQADWIMGIMEFDIYKERDELKEREVVPAFRIVKPAFA